MQREQGRQRATTTKEREVTFYPFLAEKPHKKNAPRVTSPPPVHAAPFLPESNCHSRGVTPVSDCQGAVVGVNQPHPCPSTLKLMQQLKVKIEAMPKDIAPPAHTLLGR